MMALITSYCDAMRTHEHQMALIASECVSFTGTKKKIATWAKAKGLEHAKAMEMVTTAPAPMDPLQFLCRFDPVHGDS